MTRARDAGFTLIEVLVSLALFAMIAAAGLSVLDQILRSQTQTDGRLERLAGLQRMMHLVARDLSEATPGSVQGDTKTIALAHGRNAVTYMLADGAMTRAVTQGRGETSTQHLMADVVDLRWQYLDLTGDWQGAPPQNPADLQAVAMVVSLPPGMGDLRRVIALPRDGAP
jgi:general secretion pathway protein J